MAIRDFVPAPLRAERPGRTHCPGVFADIETFCPVPKEMRGFKDMSDQFWSRMPMTTRNLTALVLVSNMKAQRTVRPSGIKIPM